MIRDGELYYGRERWQIAEMIALNESQWLD
jgi:hypothetical protein